MESIGRCAGIVAASTLFAVGAAAAAPPRLRHAEEVAPRWENARAHFQAFGRSWTLDLEPNPRLARHGAGFTVERGRIEGRPGSWARITRRGDDVIGLLYDGNEFIGIEPARDLAAFADGARAIPRTGNLAYRFSDLLLDPAGLACGLDGDAAGSSPVTAAEAARALTSELAAEAATGVMRRVTLAPVADYEFAGLYGTNAESEVLARLNIVDGIFSAQVGIDIASEAPLVYRTTGASYPFPATTSAALLDQVSDFRLSRRQDAGLTHLFTGKDLEGSTVGIAWQGAVCYEREGAGLSTSAGLPRTTSALVAAHEVGHGFGAPHDGESGSACATTPTTFLMAARTSGSSTFSQCSLDQMASVIAERAFSHPSCLVLLSDFDVSVALPGDLQAEPGAILDVVVTVRNLGTEDASTLNLEVGAPDGLSFTGVRHTTGFCDFGPSIVSCDLATLGAGATWQVIVEAGADVAGRYAVTASVTAATDREHSNDAATAQMRVQNPASGGGGGSSGPAELALLGVAVLARRWRSRPPSLIPCVLGRNLERAP